MPIDEASIAQAAKPASAKPRSAACSVHRVGRRQAGGSICAVDRRCERRLADAERADDAAAPAEQRQRLRRPPGGRGLAVGAGGRDDVERCARAASKQASAIAPVAAFRPGSVAMRASSKPKASTPSASTRQVARAGVRAPPATKRRPSVA